MVYYKNFFLRLLKNFLWLPIFIFLIFVKSISRKSYIKLLWLFKNSCLDAIYDRYMSYLSRKEEKVFFSQITDEIQNINYQWIRNDFFSDLRNYSFCDENNSDVVNLENQNYSWHLSHFTNYYPISSDEGKNKSYEVEFFEHGFHIVSNGNPNCWVYIKSNFLLPSKFALEFEYKATSRFKEQIQIDFFAQSLSNRFRIISDYGETIFLDKVYKGFFLKRRIEKISRIKFIEKNLIRVDVIDNHVTYYQNGDLILSFKVHKGSFEMGRLFLLFWNYTDAKKIDIQITNFSVYT